MHPEPFPIPSPLPVAPDCLRSQIPPIKSATPFSLDFTITPSVAAHKVGGKSTIRRSAVVEGKLEAASAADLAHDQELVLEHLQHSIRYTLASMDRMSQRLVLDTEADKESSHKLSERVGSTIKAIYTE